MEETIALGFCKCGCGNKTSLHRSGPRKHQPRDWISGHNSAGSRLYPVVNGKKLCAKCGEWKSTEEFYLRITRTGAQSFRGPCKNCMKPSLNAATRRYYYSQPSKHQTFARIKRLRKHGLTEETFQALLAKQGGVCGVCGSEKPGGHGDWHIDHDHDCCPGECSCERCVRGLLCSSCNMGLGNFGDSIERLEGAVQYLRRTALDVRDPLTRTA